MLYYDMLIFSPSSVMWWFCLVLKSGHDDGLLNLNTNELDCLYN